MHRSIVPNSISPESITTLSYLLFRRFLLLLMNIQDVLTVRANKFFTKTRGTFMAQRLPIPPFTEQTAAQKARMAEDGWNSKNASAVSQAYSLDTRWRNRTTFIKGRESAEQFLTAKWQKELDYRLIKEVWAYTDTKIAVRYVYEWHDDSGNWFRSYGNENWEFNQVL